LIRLLEDTLNRKISTGSFPPGSSYSILKSQPVDSVMRLMLQVSDNFIAEQTLLGISAPGCDTLNSYGIIQKSMDSLFYDIKNDMNWVDGSGLSRYNQFTPVAIIQLLIKIRDKIPPARLNLLLPDNSKSGALPPLTSESIPYIYGKSGSMTHVYNIAGFLTTRSGKMLMFCLMNNNFNTSVTDARIQSGEILKSIRNRY